LDVSVEDRDRCALTYVDRTFTSIRYEWKSKKKARGVRTSMMQYSRDRALKAATATFATAAAAVDDDMSMTASGGPWW
jgi:hypothetical protein